MKLLAFLIYALFTIQNVLVSPGCVSQKTNTVNPASETRFLTPGSTSAKDTGIDAAIQQVLYFTNQERQKAKLSPLAESSKLMTAASNYAALMAEKDKMSHNVDDEILPERLGAVKYTWKFIGENVAANYTLSGQTTVEDQWMQSEGHRANILNANFTEIGIGIAFSEKSQRYYYCQNFGQPK